jgi:UDP:flavonoid glycosyltransferase YjiC (YdhE family)
MKVLFMVSSTGLSHLARSLELARYLRYNGVEVIFACGYGHWRQLIHAYNFDPIPLYEVRLQYPKIHGIGCLKSSELLKSFQSELTLIKTIRPDLVVSDWRMTASVSSDVLGIPCIQIWNANWGLLAGFPDLVSAEFLNDYKYVISSWLYEIRSFLKTIRRYPKILDTQVLCGYRNIIPEHFLFRSLKHAFDKVSFSWIGPLVPWPDDSSNNSGNFSSNITHEIIIAFGGHHLPDLRQLVLDVSSSIGLSCLVLNQNPPRKLHSKQFSFFPNKLTKGKIVVTHGGIGSIYQALIVGKPLLVIPQHLEQLDNGRCVEKLGVGMCITKNSLDRKTLTDAFISLLDNSFAEKAEQIGRIFRQSKPLESANSVISEVMNNE